MTPATPISIERRDLALVCGDLGRYANAENLLSQHARFLLDRAAAGSIIDNMERAVRNRWRDIARTVGVSEQDCKRISSAFAYPGFRLAAGGSPGSSRRESRFAFWSRQSARPNRIRS